MLRVRGPQAGKRRRTERGRRLPISASNLTQFLPRTPSGPALEPANFSDRSRFGLWRPTTAQAAHEKVGAARPEVHLVLWRLPLAVVRR